MEKIIKQNLSSSKSSKEDYYLVASSILQEEDDENIVDGTVKCLRGGLLKDVRENIQSLGIKPKAVITQIGGNDLAREEDTVKSITSEYMVLLVISRHASQMLML